MMKLDITKAFDSVQWPFLLEVLRAMDFSDKWREWICGQRLVILIRLHLDVATVRVAEGERSLFIAEMDVQ